MLAVIDRDLSGSLPLAPDMSAMVICLFWVAGLSMQDTSWPGRLEPALGECIARSLAYRCARHLLSGGPRPRSSRECHLLSWMSGQCPDYQTQLQFDLEAVMSDPDRRARGLPGARTARDDEQQYLRCGEAGTGVHSRGRYVSGESVARMARHGAGDLDPAELYARLRAANAAPFAAWLQLPGAHVVSSSPERLVAVEAGGVETRPIAGTRHRDPDAHTDRRLVSDLRANIKECSEHVMLVDLERNDLGRVAETGSVRVAELMTIESYRRVHHIVSSIVGRLRTGMTGADILRAAFPGGTITGCPKIRSMQIIQELEQYQPRGAYTGCCGYISRHGRMDTNILIRTLVVRGNQLRFRAGAGIVADSDPQRELEETRHKARGLVEALQG